jgi:Phage tail lysozyme
VHKVARRAGIAVPAVAVVGVLAALPQVRALISPASAATAGHPATARITDPGQLARPSVGDAASFRSETYWSQRAKTANASTSTRARAAAAAATAKKSSSSATPSASPSTQASTAPASGRGTPVCSGSGGMLPENFAEIVDFLTAHGYTGNAAAGIAGNMYQESGGNPESGGSGGGGLIGWTPLPAGLITGNPAADLQAQLEAVLTFDNNWSQYLPALDAASTPAAAADVYVTDFERAGVPAAGTREASADAVAAACHI